MMSDWLKFSPLDMTPYDRLGWFWLIENYQLSYLYLPPLFIVLLVLLVVRPVPHAPRWTLALLALSWFWCGAMFQLQYHATVNWAAPQIGWVFIVQGCLLLFVALFGKTLSWRMLQQPGFGYAVPERSRRTEHSPGLHRNYKRWPGIMVVLLGLCYPLLGWLEGRDFLQWEWFGLMPAPITFATIGVLMLCVGRWRWLLLPVPLIWMVVSAAFTWKLDLLEPYIMLAVLLALGVSVLPQPARHR